MDCLQDGSVAALVFLIRGASSIAMIVLYKKNTNLPEKVGRLAWRLRGAKDAAAKKTIKHTVPSHVLAAVDARTKTRGAFAVASADVALRQVTHVPLWLSDTSTDERSDDRADDRVDDHATVFFVRAKGGDVYASVASTLVLVGHIAETAKPAPAKPAPAKPTPAKYVPPGAKNTASKASAYKNAASENARDWRDDLMYAGKR